MKSLYSSFSSFTIVVGGLQELGDVEGGGEGEHGQQILEHAAPQGGAVAPRLAVVERVVHGRVSGGQEGKEVRSVHMDYRFSISCWPTLSFSFPLMSGSVVWSGPPLL